MCLEDDNYSGITIFLICQYLTNPVMETTKDFNLAHMSRI